MLVPATKRPETRRPMAERSANPRPARFSEKRTKKVLNMRPASFGAAHSVSRSVGHAPSRTVSSFAVIFQKFFGLEGRHASGTGRRDGLAVAAVLHIAAGVNAMHLGEDIVVRFEITVTVSVELPGKHLGVWVVADAEKQGAGREL